MVYSAPLISLGFFITKSVKYPVWSKSWNRNHEIKNTEMIQ